MPRAEAGEAREARRRGLCKHEGFDQGNGIRKLSPIIWKMDCKEARPERITQMQVDGFLN